MQLAHPSVAAGVADHSDFQRDPFMKAIVKQYVPIGKTTATHDPSLFPALNAVEGQGFLQTMAQQIILGQDPSAIVSRAAATLSDTLKGL